MSGTLPSSATDYVYTEEDRKLIEGVSLMPQVAHGTASTTTSALILRMNTSIREYYKWDAQRVVVNWGPKHENNMFCHLE